jgi:hypothetical protein
MMFCLSATVGRRIGNPCKMRHLAAKSADSMLLNLPHSIFSRFLIIYRLEKNTYFAVDERNFNNFCFKTVAPKNNIEYSFFNQYMVC